MMRAHRAASNPLAPRILRIRLPREKAYSFMLVVLAVGILASYMIIVSVLAVILYGIFEHFHSEPPQVFIVVVIIMAGVGPLLCVRLYNRWQHRRRMKPTKHRDERLGRLFTNGGPIGRLPHRYIEYLMRQRSFSTKLIKRALRTMQPGTVIVVNSPRLDEWPHIKSNNISFEPIDLLADDERATWLVAANMEAQGLSRNDLTKRQDEPAEGSLRDLYKRGKHGLDVIAGVAYMALFMYWMVSSSDLFLKWFAMCAAVTWALSTILSSGILLERRWWVVPGGLFYREHRFWRKGMRVKLLTVSDTPLLLHYEKGWGLVVDEGKVRRIRQGAWVCLALLAGWISRARTPGEQEMLSFVGADKSGGQLPPGDRTLRDE